MNKELKDILLNALEAEKGNLAPKLPGFLRKVWIKFLSLKMYWEVKKSFAKYRLEELLLNNPETTKVAATFVFSLSRMDTFWGKSHKKMLLKLKSNEFLDGLSFYGDSFMATVLDNVKDDIWGPDQVDSIAEIMEGCLSVFLSSRFQNFYGSTFFRIPNIKGDNEKRNLANQYLARIFMRLWQSSSLMEKYFVALEKVEDELVFPAIYTAQLVSEQVGTSKAYEGFSLFCEKFSNRPQFSEMLDVAGMLASCNKPEVFQETLLWMAQSPLDPAISEQALIQSKMLLETQQEEGAYTVFSYDRYLKYLKEKEENFSLLKEEDANYYFKKAVEFFVL